MFAGIIQEIAGFYLLSRTRELPGMLDGELQEWLPNDDGEIDGDGRGRAIGRRRARHGGIVGRLSHPASCFTRRYPVARRPTNSGAIPLAQNAE